MLPPTKSGGATLLKNDDFRIDYQGYFNSDPYEIGWINHQVQENTPRKVKQNSPIFKQELQSEELYGARSY